MKLNHFTDFGMRVLMTLNHQKENEQSSLDSLSETFKISRNHLIKVVQFLSKNDLVFTKRGKSGGIVITQKAKTMQLGNLIHLLEQDKSPVIDCNTKPCIFQSHQCKLKNAFNMAYQAFIDSLNRVTLDDLSFANWQAIHQN